MSLRGILKSSYYLGDVNDCRVDVDGTIIRVIAAGNTYNNFKIGEPVSLEFSEYLVFEYDGTDQTKILS